MKRSVVLSAAIASALASIQPLHAHNVDYPQASPAAAVSQTVGVTELRITYHRPGVKGRTIFGGLVPWDAVWRTGANQATTFETSTDVTIGGQKVAAGTYSLHTIPGKTEWTIIFNTDVEQWGSFNYSPAKDALRIKVTPTEGPAQELMQFSFPEVTPRRATVELAWDRTRVQFHVDVDTDALVLAAVRKNMEDMSNWKTPFTAARYAFDNNLEPAEAARWLDQSIALRTTFANHRLKALMLAREGKNKDAVSWAEKAIKMGKANGVDASELDALQKQVNEWKKPAGK